ncbi:hypothetical protein M758_11G084400 [Ceratodon purpureus]|nr:hypothetical protein M758_11G084400 [Ceratodon purpureus]
MDQPVNLFRLRCIITIFCRRATSFDTWNKLPNSNGKVADDSEFRTAITAFSPGYHIISWLWSLDGDLKFRFCVDRHSRRVLVHLLTINPLLSESPNLYLRKISSRMVHVLR